MFEIKAESSVNRQALNRNRQKEGSPAKCAPAEGCKRSRITVRARMDAAVF